MVTLFQDNNTVVHQVELDRPDGTRVRVGVSSNVPDGTGPPTAPGPPLTLDQAYDIAVDPRLTLYPAR